MIKALWRRRAEGKLPEDAESVIGKQQRAASAGRLRQVHQDQPPTRRKTPFPSSPRRSFCCLTLIVCRSNGAGKAGASRLIQSCNRGSLLWKQKGPQTGSWHQKRSRNRIFIQTSASFTDQRHQRKFLQRTPAPGEASHHPPTLKNWQILPPSWLWITLIPRAAIRLSGRPL